jgi:hypothetical protein
MDKVYAYINHGEWKVDCPKCGRATRITRGLNKYICLVCWPGIKATALQEIVTVTNGITQKILRPVPDLAARQAAIVAARQDKEEYNILFPQHSEEIEASISTEPDRNWQNWYPDQPETKAKHPTASAYGQTLADIQEERVTHGKLPKVK